MAFGDNWDWKPVNICDECKKSLEHFCSNPECANHKVAVYKVPKTDPLLSADSPLPKNSKNWLRSRKT
jgi:hypothetical protein